MSQFFHPYDAEGSPSGRPSSLQQSYSHPYDKHGMLRNDPGTPQPPESPQQPNRADSDPSLTETPEDIGGFAEQASGEDAVSLIKQMREELQELRQEVQGNRSIMRKLVQMQPNERKDVSRGVFS